MSFETIAEYNDSLITNLQKISLEEYFKAIHAQFHPDQDISFMEYFLELCTHAPEEFVVNHTKLRKYGVITSSQSADVYRAMNQFDLENDVDYRVRNVAEPVAQGGFSTKKVYILTQSAFKLCLMRAKNTKVFAKYYILLEKVFAYYTAYEREYTAKIISMKDSNIDRLEQKIDKQSEDFKQHSDTQNQKIDQLLQFGNKLVGQNDNLQLSIDMTRDELAESLSYLVDKSYHSTIDPMDESKITHIAALAPDNDTRSGKTILIRGQLKQIYKVKAKNIKTHVPVIDITYNANAINLIENAKQEFFRMRKQYVYNYNIPIIAYNAKLKVEIEKYNREAKKHNKRNPATFRVLREYRCEKREKLTNSNIPITFNNTYILFKKNNHISYDEVIDIIVSVNKKTQKSPAESEASDPE